EDIARSGGGIASTVAATRTADEAALLQQSLPRLRALLAEGVTTVEIKSGYGLALEHERKCLRVARMLGRHEKVDVRTTFLRSEDIARSGGGIASTVAATRTADEAALLQQSLPRLRALLAEGVTTVEIKSGYGLALEHERKCLRVARMLGRHEKVDVRTTFL